MLRSFDHLVGYDLRAKDGRIGKVADVLFDDAAWFARYLVADTGGWLDSRKVLIAPESLGEADFETNALPVSLTKSEVESSPSLATDAPVSRQQERALRRHFGWFSWWAQPQLGSLPPSPGETSTHVPPSTTTAIEDPPSGDPNLRSCREVIDYHIDATDGEIGHVSDFVFDDFTWKVRYLVVATRNWLPGKKVLISPDWIEAVRWADRKVSVGLERQRVKDAPEYLPTAPINREYEARLYDFYGRPVYWERKEG
jgi:hypothetical protein